MSSVDSAINVNVGILSDIGIPIYWCLEDLEHDYNGEIITRKDLIIGGGSGEHPALLIKNANLLPLKLLCDEMDNDEIYQLYRSKLIRELDLDIDSTYAGYEAFMFISDWPLSTWLKTINVMQLNGYSGNDFEKVFLHSITKFIYQNMPFDFYENDVLDIMKKYQTEIEQELDEFDFITIARLDSSNSSGKNIVNGQVVWGFSLEQYQSR